MGGGTCLALMRFREGNWDDDQIRDRQNSPKGESMRLSLVVAAAIMILWPNGLLAQRPGAKGDAPGVVPGRGQPAQGEARLGVEYFKGYASDFGHIVASPSSWGAGDWLKFSLIVGITAAVVDEDEDVQGWVQNHRSASTDRIARLAKPLGNGKYTLPALGTLYCYGSFFESERARRTALLGVESFIITGIFTETIKHVSHKHRPSSESLDDPLWDGPQVTRANLSFPSGHAASAFAVATVVASQYGDNALVPPLMYGAATLCALSRVNDDTHWASDILLGSAIGHLTAKVILGLQGAKDKSHLTITPTTYEGRSGLSVGYRF